MSMIMRVGERKNKARARARECQAGAVAWRYCQGGRAIFVRGDVLIGFL